MEISLAAGNDEGGGRAMRARYCGAAVQGCVRSGLEIVLLSLENLSAVSCTPSLAHIFLILPLLLFISSPPRPVHSYLVAQRIAESGFDMKKAAIAAIPVAAIATPAFAMDSIIEALPTQTLALEVQFGAYLAVLLGTLLPVLFLINLYVQTESRKAGRDGGQDAQ